MFLIHLLCFKNIRVDLILEVLLIYLQKHYSRLVTNLTKLYLAFFSQCNRQTLCITINGITYIILIRNFKLSNRASFTLLKIYQVNQYQFINKQKYLFMVTSIYDKVFQHFHTTTTRKNTKGYISKETIHSYHNKHYINIIL